MQKSSTMGLRGSRIFNGGRLTIGMVLGDRSSCTLGRGRGVTPEEPAAENLHGGIREGGSSRCVMIDLTGHEAGNGGHSQGKSNAHRHSSTRTGKDSV
jgi:hypothetical protein